MVLCCSDATSKHFDSQCLHNAKGTMHFGCTLTIYMKKFFSQFLHNCFELFWERRELLQVNHGVVLDNQTFFWQKHQGC